MDIRIPTGVLIAIIVHVAFVEGTIQTTVCKQDGDCETGQCCYIKPEFEVVSKRQLQPIHLPGLLHRHNDTGVCETYHMPGESCGVFETANKHCGCGYGTTCGWVTATTVIPHRRSSFLPPGPGAFQCA